MRQSNLFGRSTRQVPKEETSLNAQLLIKGGYVDKLMAGVFSYLPLGLRVMAKLQGVVRQEMNAVDGQEIFMPALQPKDNWQTTGRWDTVDVLFKIKSQTKHEYALGPTHEEIVVPLAQKFVNSYRDLPLSLYQIQTKFRDELRSKSGLLRGREFMMKDMYSFHTSAEDLGTYYNRVIEAYKKIFKHLELTVLITEASGGTFTKKYSHEFQVVTPAGEDVTIFCAACQWAQNKEISKLKAGDKCPGCGKGKLEEAKSIEAANIFDLGTKFSQDFKLKFKDKDGSDKDVVIGCYGIGVSRLMGTVVEARSDEKGIVWPRKITPYHVHLLNLGKEAAVTKKAEDLYHHLTKAGFDVLLDDRETSAGEKFNNSDLLGISVRLVVSSKTGDMVEVKERSQKDAKMLSVEETVKFLRQYYS